ncbi:MAG: type II toxin-antitoxin system VapC family toxin [Chloroflexi bacterium]|nr:type II toxin-antitoxin system VapC family toxin [Chloroflexota bacterium]
MTDVIVDTSFMIPIVLPEVHSLAARARSTGWDLDGARRIVPQLYAAEATSALRRHVHGGTMLQPAASLALNFLIASVVFWPDDHYLASRAQEIAGIIGAGRAYDSLYAALAEREGFELWTGDERFYNATRSHFPFVHWVGESPT